MFYFHNGLHAHNTLQIILQERLGGWAELPVWPGQVNRTLSMSVKRWAASEQVPFNFFVKGLSVWPRRLRSRKMSE